MRSVRHETQLAYAFWLRGVRRRPVTWATATAIAPGLLGTLLIGSIICAWWHPAGYFWYFLPGTAVPQKPAVIYARAIYHSGFRLILFSLATVMASFTDYFIVKKVLEL